MKKPKGFLIYFGFLRRDSFWRDLKSYIQILHDISVVFTFFSLSWTVLVECFVRLYSSRQGDNTEQLHAELRIHSSILRQGSHHQSIGPVALHQLNVLPHHLHLLVWVQKVPPTRPYHRIDRDFDALLHHLQQTCGKSNDGETCDSVCSPGFRFSVNVCRGMMNHAHRDWEWGLPPWDWSTAQVDLHLSRETNTHSKQYACVSLAFEKWNDQYALTIHSSQALYST